MTIDPVLITKETYNSTHKEFINRTRDFSGLPELSDEINAFIKILPGKNILDIGFGSGRDTIYFLKNDLSVISIDIVKEFIDNLSEKHKAKICYMDMRLLGFREAVFHGLWCCASLLHIPRPQIESTLRGFNKILSKNGILYLSVKEGQGEEWVNAGKRKKDRYFVYFSREEIISLVISQGFEIVNEYIKSSSVPHMHWISIFARKMLS